MRASICLLFLISLVGVFAYENTCENRIFHLLDRFENSGLIQLSEGGYKNLFEYFENRLLQNQTYTECYDLKIKFCARASQKILPDFFANLKKIENPSSIELASELYYIRAIGVYFLQRCGRNYTTRPDVLEKDAFNREKCRHSTQRIYSFLTSRDHNELLRIHTHQYSLLVRAAILQFEEGEARECFNPYSTTGRTLIQTLKNFIQTEDRQDRALLHDVWNFLAYFGVEYIKDGGLDLNVTRVCDRDLGQMLEYTEKEDGYDGFDGFNFFFWRMHHQSRCFKNTRECRAYRNDLSAFILNETSVPRSQREFANYWGPMKFNIRHYIYNCYFTGGNDTSSSIWKFEYKFSDANCTARVKDVINTLRSNEIEAIGNTNVSGPILGYLNHEISDLGQTCLEKSPNCTVWAQTTKKLFWRAIRAKTNMSYDDRTTYYENYFVAKINALKYFGVCGTKNSGTGLHCSSHLVTFRDNIVKALKLSNVLDATSALRENKVTIEKYRECQMDKGKTQLCLELSAGVRENYVRALFSPDLETLKQKMGVLVQQLSDINEECTSKGVQSEFKPNPANEWPYN